MTMQVIHKHVNSASHSKCYGGQQRTHRRVDKKSICGRAQGQSSERKGMQGSNTPETRRNPYPQLGTVLSQWMDMQMQASLLLTCTLTCTSTRTHAFTHTHTHTHTHTQTRNTTHTHTHATRHTHTYTHTHTHTHTCFPTQGAPAPWMEPWYSSSSSLPSTSTDVELGEEAHKGDRSEDTDTPSPNRLRVPRIGRRRGLLEAQLLRGECVL